MNQNLLSLSGLIAMTLITTPVQSEINTKLPLCPKSPNCVSSQAKDASHLVAPFKIIVSPEAAWSALQAAIKKIPRTKIVSDQDKQLHAETSSQMFGFVDDINVIMNTDDHVIEIRSASRTGYSDFGVNRKRIEALRNILIKEKVIE